MPCRRSAARSPPRPRGDADAVAAHLDDLRLALLVQDRGAHASEYTDPSAKTCPTSIPGQLQRSLAVRRRIPATTLRKSAIRSGSGRSRPQLTPVRW
jgi:hypothetical protein